MIAVENHNSGQWLQVRWLEEGTSWPTYRGRGGRGLPKGWYVVRICPCHDGHPVTRGYERRERADRVMRAMVDVAMILGT